MGLDMFFYARIKSTAPIDGWDYFDSDLGYSMREVAYWRKANMIHGWFVREVQGGEDDCGDYVVSREKLKELRKLCIQVQHDINKGVELLPTQDGFFFGSMAYDDRYLEDVSDTILKIDAALMLPEKYELVYSSSW